jgi:hypothetical protein
MAKFAEGNSNAFDLSRIQAEGWTAARKYLISGDPGNVNAISALNPYKMALERSRWYAGFNNAVEKM